MARLLLALLIVFQAAVPFSFAQDASDPPVDLTRNPEAVGPADRALLSAAGYSIDGRWIKRGDEAALTRTRLACVLAWLKPRTENSNGGSRKKSGSAVDSERFGAALSRIQKAWRRQSGDDVDISVSIKEGGPAPVAGVPVKARTAQGAADASATKTGIDHDAVAGTAPAGTTSGAFAPATHSYSLTKAPTAEAGGALGVLRARGLIAPAKPGPAHAQKPAAGVPPPPASGQDYKNPQAPAGRLASFFLSDDLITQIVKEHLKTDAIKDIDLQFDPDKQEVVATGVLKVPLGALSSLNIDGVSLPDFKFQLGIKPRTTKEGYLVLEFPLAETFFYPADSKDPAADRVIVPVQFLQLALSSARGYLAVLSGDLSAFDKREAGARAQIAALDKKIAAAKDADEKADLSDQRAQAILSQQSIPIERRQAQRLAKKLSGVMSFVGEKELNIDKNLSVDRNTIVLKLRLEQLAPFLKGVQLGGIRIVKDTKDGSGEDFIAIDLVPEAR